MQRFHSSVFATLLSSLLLLGACSSGHLPSAATPSAASSSIMSIVGRIDGVMDKLGRDIAIGDLTVSNGHYGEAQAEITPQGDLLIAGKPVPLSSAQRRAVLAYRQQLVEIAQQGMQIGKQGATLGMRVAGEALAGAFPGQSEQQIRQHAEDQAAGIRKAAAKLCDRLNVVMAGQQTLAADVPAFKPYATMSAKDISECRQGM